ncbi:hypothetical protein [Streptomyces griseorubiginosus]|uniref:Uncharacterized protein n=1 Tax=Streptomyces griseorubiginosus TaxID=67304 RepID=A0AAI8L5G6_9ACTN|nr:hypothetical protein [Streptomyces griseorubiginosus]AYC41985.1 hypothetical protein DWG14_06276 [Streptomyces griseorubiginosus]
MPTLEPRYVLCADGGGRVETSNHPDRPGIRVWACTSCEARGEGTEHAIAHAAHCRSVTGRRLPRGHFS